MDNGVVVDADINLGVRVIDLYHAAGGTDTLIEIDLQAVRYDIKLEHKAVIGINLSSREAATALVW